MTLTFDEMAGGTAMFTVSIINDAAVDRDEEEFFSFVLSDLSTMANVSAGFYEITILDDDSARVTFAPASVTVDEDVGSGTAIITATVDTAVDGGFEVTVSTADGTAISPGDFTAVSGMTLTFVGDAGETETFPVVIINDTVAEGEEMFTVSLSSSGGRLPDVGVTVSGTRRHHNHRRRRGPDGDCAESQRDRRGRRCEPDGHGDRDAFARQRHADGGYRGDGRGG